jgi:hypothetical protein
MVNINLLQLQHGESLKTTNINLLCNMSHKMDLQEVGWRSMDWIDLAQDRDRWRAIVNVVMKLRVP